jgi:hypothetical protein
MAGEAWTAKTTQGNVAMKGWMDASGVKFVPNPKAGGVPGSGNNSTFGDFSGYQPTGDGKTGSGVSPGKFVTSSGQVLTPAQAVNSLVQWAHQNGVDPGDFHV